MTRGNHNETKKQTIVEDEMKSKMTSELEKLIEEKAEFYRQRIDEKNLEENGSLVLTSHQMHQAEFCYAGYIAGANFLATDLKALSLVPEVANLIDTIERLGELSPHAPIDFDALKPWQG